MTHKRSPRLTKRQRSVLRKWHADPGTAYTNATAIEWGIAKKLARRGYLDGNTPRRPAPPASSAGAGACRNRRGSGTN